LTGRKISDLEKISLYPAKHFIMAEDKIKKAIVTIKYELEDRINSLKKSGKNLDADRCAVYVIRYGNA
jgi:excinuclease ABC subunit B